MTERKSPVRPKVVRLSVLIMVCVFCTLPRNTQAAAVVTVTSATGGGAISADTVDGAYTALDGPVFTEESVHSIGTGDITLTVPSGFVFDTGSEVTVTSEKKGACGAGTFVKLLGDAATQTVIPTETTVTVTVTAESASHATCQSTLTWSGVRVRPTAGTPLVSGNLTHTGSAVIVGVNSSTNLGTLTETVGAVATITVSPAGTSIPVGNTQQYTSEGFDQFGSSVPVSITWSSSNEGIATIGASSGLATGVAGGTANIVATDVSTRTGTTTLSVTSLPDATPVDTTPNSFSFTNQESVALAREIVSNAIEVSGINTATEVSVTGGEYSVNGLAYTSATSTVTNGDRVSVRHTSAGIDGGVVTTVLTIGGVSGTFMSTAQVHRGGGGRRRERTSVVVEDVISPEETLAAIAPVPVDVTIDAHVAGLQQEILSLMYTLVLSLQVQFGGR